MTKYWISVYNLHVVLVDVLTVDWLINECKEHIANAEELGVKPYLILADIPEGRIYDESHATKINLIRKHIIQLNVDYVFLCDGDFEEYSKLAKSSDIIYLDYLSLVSYVKTVEDPNQIVNEQWNSNTHKGLWTPGKPERPHRIHFMRKMWENNLLNHLEWSFNITDAILPTLRNDFIHHYTDEQFNSFIRDCTKSLDLISRIKDDTFSFNGYPYNHEIYQNTLISVIAESDFQGCVNGEQRFMTKITEKTNRAILNMHPIIYAYYPGSSERLRSKGYRSFDKYMTIPEYNEIQDMDDRLNAVIENITTFKDKVNDPEIESQIRKDIEFNYNHYLSRVEIEKSKIQYLFDLPQTEHHSQFTLNSFVFYFFPENTNGFVRI